MGSCMHDFLDSEQFVDHLLSCFFADLRTEQKDNYDWARFSQDGVDRSDVPYTQLHKAAMLALTRQSKALFEAYCLLEDKKSRALFIDLMRYRLAGHKHVRLPTNNEAYWQKCKAANSVPCRVSPLLDRARHAFGLNHYQTEFEGQHLDMHILTLIWPFYLSQYYFDRDGVRIRPEKGDHVVDAGACFGETALAFGASVGQTGAVYLFELLEAHLAICKQNMKLNERVSRFKLFNQGLSDVVREASGKSEAGEVFDLGFELKEDDTRFAITTLDHLVERGEVERVDYIKMDIEGSELRALKGAEETLRRFKPKLAISLYHDVRDFYEIPLYLNSLGLGYRFYLDHYTIHVGETVLYASAAR